MSREQGGADTTLSYTPLKRETIVRDYCSRGLLVLSPDVLGIDPCVHQQIYQTQKQLFHDKQHMTASTIPDVLQIIDAPAVVEVCDLLIGPNWAIVPFTHNSPFMSGSNDQHWHKDDNGPFNSRKHRHHQAVQLEMLYYPQEVKADMGPTATVPYSQYWTFNHEENHDNFAGADHLDFGYQLNGMERVPISGPRSEYDLEDIRNQRTAHDVRMREAVEKLNWPLNRTFEVGPLDAGSVVLYSHNLLHRGNHRRDDWNTWRNRPRFMWRFWLYRTTEPGEEELEMPRFEESDLSVDPMTGVDRRGADADVLAVWNCQQHWIYTGRTRCDAKHDLNAHSQEAKAIARLTENLYLFDDQNEPKRIGAAYRLAALGKNSSAQRALENALHSDRESVRRAATYGLVALGGESTSIALRAVDSASRWLRKAATYILGESGELSQDVVAALSDRLLNDPSVYVRSVAAGSLGCFGRRALKGPENAELAPSCLLALLRSLEQEPNRLSMDRAQNRSIKMVRPTDECDVCEGIGFDFGQERYKPVRSAVRENALWSIVILCSHGAVALGTALEPAIKALTHVIDHDENAFCVGFAMDSLNRLANLHPKREGEPAAVTRLRANLDQIFDASPIHSPEPMVRGGLSAELAAQRHSVNVLTLRDQAKSAG